MASSRTWSLLLELDDASADTIGGRLSDERGTTIEFSGWLSLASALEAAMRATPALLDDTSGAVQQRQV